MQICIFVEHANSAMCVECSSSHRELFNSLSLGKPKKKEKKEKGDGPTDVNPTGHCWNKVAPNRYPSTARSGR
jgi:hypothetical protein